MATSGSYDFTVTRDDIITEALVKLRVINEGDTPSATQLTSASRKLNMMVKAWVGKGVFLWAIDSYQKKAGTSHVVVGTDGNDYECILSHTSGADTKPITGDNWTTYWLATGGTGAGAVWVTATAYASNGDFTLNAEIVAVEEAFVRRDSVDNPLRVITREEYMAEPNKALEGLPTRFYFERIVGGSKIYLLPRPSESTDVSHFELVRKLQDFDAAADNPDTTSEWFEALYLGLAYKMAAGANLSISERQSLKMEADEAFYVAALADTQRASLRIRPRLK